MSARTHAEKYSRNRALQGAFVKGYDARFDGTRSSANPYPDRRTDRGAVTWSRAFRRAWLAGWQAAHDIVQPKRFR